MTLEQGSQASHHRSSNQPERSPDAPLVWARAEDVWIFDSSGRRFLDFTSSALVANVGHCHPRVVSAIQEQAGRLMTTYVAPHALRDEVVARLVQAGGEHFGGAMLFSGGAEAIDASTRMARIATSKFEIVSFLGAFHGRSWGALSAGGLPHTKDGVGPRLPGFLIAPYPDPSHDDAIAKTSEDVFKHIDALWSGASSHSVAAVLVEPYLGAGGSIVPPTDFIPGLRRWCDERGALLILDEVQSSFGRVGSMFAFEQIGVRPDLLVVGKGLAGGFPMSAVLYSHEVAAAISLDAFSSTFGGNPLACAASLATLDVLRDENLPGRASRTGNRILERLRSWIGRIPIVSDARGWGLALAMEMTLPNTTTPAADAARALVQESAKRGLALLPPIGPWQNVIRIGPPLTISQEDADAGLDILEEALGSIARMVDAQDLNGSQRSR